MQLMQQALDFIQQQQLLFWGLAAILCCLIAVEWRIKLKGPQGVAPTKATLLINHQQAQIIDIRSAEAFSKGHILGSRNIGQDKLTTAAAKGKLDKERPVIIVCDRGNLGRAAAVQLQAQGFTKIYNLDGGITAWRDENLPLAK